MIESSSMESLQNEAPKSEARVVYRAINALKVQESFNAQEEKYMEARIAYENGSESMSKLSERYNLNYVDFRFYLQVFHPESRLLRAYSKSRKRVMNETSLQIARLKAMESSGLKQMSEKLDREMNKLGRPLRKG